MHASFLTSPKQPPTESERINLCCGSIAADNFHRALSGALQPLGTQLLFLPWSIMSSKLCPTGSTFQPILSATTNCLFAVLAEGDAGAVSVAP